MWSEVSYELQLEELQILVEDQLSMLLVDQSSIVKRSMLLDLAPLCIFFGREKTNDILLSHMITYLNDRDWLLRYAFFDSVIDIAACLGGRNLEEYIFPLITQALSGRLINISFVHYLTVSYQMLRSLVLQRFSLH